ncbi:proteophosphoglycan 5 [Lentinula edodes]|uniref:Proteophosphoglycan 5 n=1 Tax=Lentinula edodes TaxID=5353 RepID=A0A1Q3DVJ8_LENED|nr:proteophosphoglycan 5 [Lentinula edodes]
MNNLKRKRGDSDDIEDENPSFGKQILPVANLPNTFDGIPGDGMEYLFTVRRDARLLPHVCFEQQNTYARIKGQIGMVGFFSRRNLDEECVLFMTMLPL